jgi:hypothetical protein
MKGIETHSGIMKAVGQAILPRERFREQMMKRPV